MTKPLAHPHSRPIRTRQRVASANAELLADVQMLLAEYDITIVDRPQTRSGPGGLLFIRGDGVLRVDRLAVIEDLAVGARR